MEIANNEPDGGTMVNALPAPALRVKEAAGALGLAVSVQVMPDSTRTAEEAARTCNCPVGAIVKSLVFRGKESGRPYLLLVSGSNRVNEKAVAARLGEAITRPDAAFVREATGFAIGGIPPLGHATPLVPYFDADLLQYETVWAAAGTHNAVFAVAPGRLAEATGAIVMAMT
jgi:prolyl-tRNA editing enzyme YbaK/EbsC (Cys-tRNA(Pro) deacylase)